MGGARRLRNFLRPRGPCKSESRRRRKRRQRLCASGRRSRSREYFPIRRGRRPPAPVAGIAPSIFRPDPRLATPYSQQASLGAQYLIAHNLTASADYLFVRGVKLSRTRNINLLPPVILTAQNAASLGIPNPSPQQLGREVFGPGRVNPQFNDVYQLEDSASSTYNGVTLSLNRRMANEFEFLGKFTFSKNIRRRLRFFRAVAKSIQCGSGTHSLASKSESAIRIRRLVGLADRAEQDDPHPASGQSSSWFVPCPRPHYGIAPILTLDTGRPVNPLVGLDISRSDAFPLADGPLGLGRNSLRTGNLHPWIFAC